MQRRDFLKTFGAGSALLLSGCSSLDQIVIGDVDGGPEKVLIIGAGLAGLTAAYELKKRQIPFVLMEASARIGGRVWTVRGMNISSQNGELGGEDIEISHKEIQNLAKDLQLTMNELSPVLGYSWLSRNEDVSARDWLREGPKLENLFKKLQSEAYGTSVQYLSQKNQTQFPRAVVFDKMSVAELINVSGKNMSGWMKPFLQKLTETQWGATTEEMSALHLMHWMRESFAIQRRKFLRVDGGAENIAQSLYDRVAGVIPDRYVKFRHMLKGIDRNAKNWELEFVTPQGDRTFQAKAVICTLPPAIFSTVKGWDHLAGIENRISGSLRMKSAAQSKMLISFKDRFWREHAVLAGGGSVISDSSLGQLSNAGTIPPFAMGLHGILQAQFGGANAEKLNPESLKTILSDLEVISNKANTFENIYQLQNWKNYPWSKGGRSFASPGQFQTWDENPVFENMNSWAFAGEAQSLRYLGTMNGAVETALMAVEKVSKLVSAT